MEMIQLTYVLGFAMAIVNVFKGNIDKRITPFVALFLVIAFNVVNAFLFGGDLLAAGRDAFIQGGIAIGMFAGGDKLRKM